jgi:hypothetical protein
LIVTVAKSRYYPGICLDGLRKTTKKSFRIGGVPAEIRCSHFVVVVIIIIIIISKTAIFEP